MVQMQKNKKEVTVDSQKKPGKRARKGFPQTLLFPQGSTILDRLAMAMLKKWTIKNGKVVKKGRSEKITSGSTKRCRRKEKNCPCLKNGTAANWLP